jgi:arginine exporter protein ArgO
MIAALAAGLVAGLGIAMPLGAIGTYLVGLGARAPRRVGVAAALGVASTDGAYALLAVVGGVALQSALRPAASWLRWLSVLALCGLGALTVLAGWRRYRRDSVTGAQPRIQLSPVRAYLGLLGLTALNPATLAYFTALVLGHQAAGTATRWERAAFVLGAFLASAAWQLLLVRGGALLGRLAAGARGRLGIAIVSGAVMLVLAVQLAAE